MVIRNRQLRFSLLIGCLLITALACKLPFTDQNEQPAGQIPEEQIGDENVPEGESGIPTWLHFGENCATMMTSSLSGGSPYVLDEQGNPKELLPKDMVTCFLQVQICGDMIVKTQVINTAASEQCPPLLHFSYAPQTPVCCEHWQAAKISKTPCDPLHDSDCDGIPNLADNYFLDSLKP